MRCSGSGQEELATTTTREVDRPADEIQGAQPPAANHLIQGRLTYDCRVTTTSPHHASVLDGVARRLGGGGRQPGRDAGLAIWHGRHVTYSPNLFAALQVTEGADAQFRRPRTHCTPVQCYARTLRVVGVGM